MLLAWGSHQAARWLLRTGWEMFFISSSCCCYPMHLSFFAGHEDPHFRKDPVRLPSRTWSCFEKAGHVSVGLLLSVGTHRLFPAPTVNPTFTPGDEGPESPLPWLGALSCPSQRLSHAGLHSHWLLETQGGYSPRDGCGEMGRGCGKG